MLCGLYMVTNISGKNIISSFWVEWPTGQHSVTIQETTINTFTAMETSNLRLMQFNLSFRYSKGYVHKEQPN
jgi:hypothetical protein